jgi:transcriptional regulator with XRE-family HTH domain
MMCISITIVILIDMALLTHDTFDMNPDSIYRHIGEVIRTRRATLRPKLTQQQLAARVGISRASLANIETGRQSVMVHQLFDLAQALELPASDLLPGSDRNLRAEWQDVLPENLKPQQQEQIARLLESRSTETSRTKEEPNAKSTKR